MRIVDGLIEVLTIESPDLWVCIGETTSRCIDRETGQLQTGKLRLSQNYGVVAGTTLARRHATTDPHRQTRARRA